MSSDFFVTKDSGERVNFTSGMTRDTATGKINYRRLLDGPMLERWAGLLARGAEKYPDVSPGVANWTLADGVEELRRFEESAFRHFIQWIRGDRDEDHAAAVIFNINGAEYVRPKVSAEQIAANNERHEREDAERRKREGERYSLHGLPSFKPNHGTLDEEPAGMPRP